MRKQKRNLAALILIAAVLLLVSGCSTLNDLFGMSAGDEIEATPQTLAYEGMEELNKENFRTAAEKFQMLKDRYPYSKYAILADLKLADAYYLKEMYIEAADAYLEFERLHPKNDAVPYAIYQVGMCYFQQMNGYERDQQPTVKAIQTFGRLIQSYPDSKYAARAMARLAECQNDLAGHEFSVGEFYFKQKAYKAAMGRFISLLKQYPDTGYHTRALEYIKMCREKIAEEEAKQTAENGEDEE